VQHIYLLAASAFVCLGPRLQPHVISELCLLYVQGDGMNARASELAVWVGYFGAVHAVRCGILVRCGALTPYCSAFVGRWHIVEQHNNVMILTVPQSRGGRAHEDVFGSCGGDYIGLDFLLGHPVVVV